LSEAASLIRDNLDLVQGLVAALAERGILSGAEVDEIISQGIAAQSIRIEHQRRVD
jgi:hypothetical protein